MLLEQLYVNWVVCYLELKNYWFCMLDCVVVLRLNLKNVKVFYWFVKVLLVVNKIVELDDVCVRGLEIDFLNVVLQQLVKEIIVKNEIVMVYKKVEEKRVVDVRRKEVLLKVVLEVRNIKMRLIGKLFDMEDVYVQFVFDLLDFQSFFLVLMMLLYFVDYESDFIKVFNEIESLEQYFGYVFFLLWDRENKYMVNNVECYVEIVSGGLVKVGKKVLLFKVLSSGNVEIVDDLFKIFVVFKGKVEGWVKDWKEKKFGRKQVIFIDCDIKRRLQLRVMCLKRKVMF